MLLVSSTWIFPGSHAHPALLQPHALPAVPSQLCPCLAVSQSAEVIKVITLQDYRFTETKRENRGQRGNYTREKTGMRFVYMFILSQSFETCIESWNHRITYYSKLEGNHMDH